MTSKLALACLILSTSACSAFNVLPPPNVTVSTAFTEDERVAISAAAAKWNTIARTPVMLNGGDWTMIKEYTPEMQAQSFAGLTTYGTHVIRIKPDLDKTKFYKVVLHELGHAQGLHHITGPGVMNSNADSSEFSEGDIEECQTEGVCGYSPVEAAKLRLQGVIQ